MTKLALFVLQTVTSCCMQCVVLRTQCLAGVYHIKLNYWLWLTITDCQY